MKREISDRIAWILPKRIIYFCLIRAWAKATTGKWSNTIGPEVRMDEVIKRWEV